MDKQYKTVYEGGVGEIIEKKSRFIATVIPCEDEETALQFIEATKKKYWDARHNCSAYTVGLNHELERCSDDGEPQKTAGRPMLDVLLNEGIHNVCVVVTRYFGGVLLGAGGLVRAYAKGAKIGIDKAGMAEFCEHVTFDFEVSYSDYEKVLRDIDKLNVINAGVDFGGNVVFHLSCVEENYPRFCTYAADLTGGKCSPALTGKTFAPKTT